MNETLKQLDASVSGVVDCWLEFKNNLARQEWEFATQNLQRLFDNAKAIQKKHKAAFRELELARGKSVAR